MYLIKTSISAESTTIKTGKGNTAKNNNKGHLYTFCFRMKYRKE